MKKLSLQLRITLTTLLLVVITCISMKVIICSSGIAQIESLGNYVLNFTNIYTEKTGSITDKDAAEFKTLFSEKLYDTEEHFCMYNWYIAGVVILAAGAVTFFVSRNSVRPIKRFSAQVEKIQMKNLKEMRMEENTVTEFRHLSRSLNDMLDRISRAFEAQHQFTANAAHELRTPLALMQTQLDIYAEENPDSSDKSSDTMTMMREQTERLSAMVKILLSMSELQTIPCNDTISIGPMIEEVITDLSSIAEEENIVLEQSGEAGIIKGSDILIYRVLFNLVENGIKYNRKGGKVSVETQVCGDSLRIYISDTGAGIPDEYRDNIFQPFFRVDKNPNRTLGGVGLGLSLVWEIVNLHRGSVELKESSENGTVIMLELPMAD